MRVTLAMLSLIAVLFAARGAFERIDTAAAVTVIVVTSTDHDTTLGDLEGNGTCDIAEAITAANSNAAVDTCAAGTPGMDVINFDIPDSGPHTIFIPLLSQFPVISEPLTIDASTAESQTECDVYQGRQLSIVITGGGERGNGLSLTEDADGSIFRGLVINGFTGVGLGTSSADDVTIQCNHVGTNVDATEAVANAFGVTVGEGGLVGGPNAADRNVLSGSQSFGLGVYGAAEVYNNHVGTNLAGTATIGNAANGIQVSGPGTVIGMVNQGNLIGGSGYHGIIVTADATIEGNSIGIGYSGEDLGNSLDGIALFAGATVRISQNRIGHNGELGIDFNNDGVTLNDPDDLDTGPNGLLNYPIIGQANQQGHEISLGDLPAAAQGYRLDYYVSSACDPSGFGEGERWEGSIEPIAGGTVHLSPNPIFGPAFTVTATDIATGAVSEFSNCVTVVPDVDCDGEPTAVDALAILRSLAGLSGGIEPVSPCTANVDGDQFTTISDALYMRSYIANPPP